MKSSNLLAVLLGALALLAFPVVTAAQTAPEAAPDIPFEVKTTKDFPLPAASQKAVDDFVAANVGLLGATTPAAQKKARDGLITAVDGETSPAFLNAYAASLNAAVTDTKAGPLVHADLRVRLNASIAIARVAEKSKNARLEPAIKQLLQSKDEALQLWGAKAAKQSILEALRANVAPGLLPNLVAAVTANPSGPITSEAYEALTSQDAAIKPATISAHVLPALTKILEARAKQYQAGVADEPEIEARVPHGPVAFVARESVFKDMPQKVKLDLTQAMFTMFVWAGQQGANLDNPGVQQQIALMLRFSGGGVDVMGRIAASPELQAAGKQLQAIPTNFKPADLSQAVQGLMDAARKVSGLEKLTNPGPVQPPVQPPTTSPAK